MEYHLTILDDVCGYAGKPFGQVATEVERVGKAQTELLKQFCQVLTLDDTTRIRIALTES